MAKSHRVNQKIIITGDKELTKWLNSLEKNTARKLHRQAARPGAKLIAVTAKQMVPRDTGRFAKSLTVRAMKRSRVRMGYVVTQKSGYQKPWPKGPGRQAFYGVFQEIGYTPGGRRKRPVATEQGGDTPKEVKKKSRKEAKKEAGKRKSTRAVSGKWAVRRAGVKEEANVIRLYHENLEALLKSQGGT